MRITVSARTKPLSNTMHEWLTKFEHSGLVKYADITGIFGFTREKSPLYGGRVHLGEEITEEDYVWMKKKGLEFKILLSGDVVSKKHYEESFELLDKYHVKGNTVVITNDKLAKWIRRDYPNYSLEASTIRQTELSDIDEVLDLYDTMVLPLRHNKDEKNLKKIKQKDRIVLFTSGSCGFFCRNQICYPATAAINRNGGKGDPKCIILEGKAPFQYLGIDKIIRFDLDEFISWGFNNFKVLPDFTYKPLNFFTSH